MKANPSPSIEPLESRIAPAAIFSYVEPDGDRVSVISSKGTGPALFVTATFSGAGSAKTLQRLDLDLAAAMFEGADIRIVVTQRGEQGDGLAKVGAIDATGMDMGNVKVQGDLGQIDAGNPALNGPALKSLTVQSMGNYGLATQGGMGDLTSTIAGTIGKFSARTNLYGVQIAVTGTGSMLGSAKIGGSLDQSGLTVAGDIGSITIGQDVRGNGSFIRSTGGNIGTVKIGGDLMAGSSAATGSVIADAGSIKRVTVGGNIIAGEASTGFGVNGGVYAGKRIGSVSVGGDIALGPTFVGSAGIANLFTGIRAGQDIGTVKVRGDLRGAGELVEIVAFKNATPGVNTAIRSISVGGSVFDATIGAGYPLGTRVGGSSGASADVQIGSISVGGDWTKSNVFCGISAPFASVGEGNEVLIAGGDPNIVARIGSVVIKGNVFGSAFGTGFIAEEIGSFSINGAKLPLKPLSAAEDRFVIGGSGSVRVYEV